MIPWLHTQWFGYFWPSDKGNGPEAIQQTLVYGLIAAILIPPVRHFFKRHFEKLHSKMDHIIEHTESIPDYVEPEFEKFEHWLVTWWKWLTTPIRKLIQRVKERA